MIQTRRAVIASALAATAAGTLSGPAEAKPAIGKPAPKFKLKTFDRKIFSSADLPGNVVVLNYWATWCAPCRHELPLMDAYVRRKGGPDLRVFAITVDDVVSDAELKPLAAALSFPLISRLDSLSYGPIGGSIPTSYVIDRQGVLRYAKAEAFTYESFEAVVSPLLKAA